MKKVSLVLSFVFMCVMLGGFSVVFAQDDDSDEFTLEEITVTAAKTGTQDLQKVGMSIEVMQGEKIRNTGRTSMQDVLRDIPNISTTDAGNGVVTINIRGLGMDLPVGEGTGEASVSTNFDGANQSRPEGQLFGFFDVDQVEVLRGPQGTLYGRNATGGAINIVSTKPSTDEVKGYTSLEIGSYSKKKAEAAVNVPITDTFAARLASVFTQQDAYTKDDHGFRDTMSGLSSRLQLRYMPNDETSVNLLTSYYKTDGSTFGNYVSDDNWAAGNYETNISEYPTDLTKKNTTESFKVALNVETPVGPGILTFLPTLEKLKSRGSSFAYDLPPNTEPSDTDVPEIRLEGRPWDNETRTAEVRYTSKNDATIKWVGGLYYTETDEPMAPRYGDYLNGARGNAQPGPQPEYWYETGAAFGQATIPVMDSLRVILGLRYSYDKKGFDDTRYDPSSGSYKYDYVDWKVGVEKDFGEDIMGYLTASSGHKPGGYNADTGSVFDPEEAISGELGVKSRLMNNRLQLNGDAFYYSYDGYQTVDAYFEDPDDPSTMIVTFFNADKARVYGAELDASFLVGSSTLFNTSLAYLKNEYTSDFFLHETPTEEVNLKGDPMPHSPEFSFKFSAQHDFVLPDGSSITPNVSYRWTDGQYVGVFVSEETWSPSYEVVDVSIAYASTSSWTLNFYCNNALDEHYYTAINGAGSSNVSYAIGTPLTAGVIWNVNF
jgi:iron complex outermembrane receptor protein